MSNISVVIPTYQRCHSLRQVLLACGQQTLSPDWYEVIVTIDGSTDETEGMLRRFDAPYRLRWVAGPNGGPGAARNRGAALAEGDVVLFLDDDIIMTPPLLAEHAAGHETGPDRVCLGQVRVWRERPLSHWEQYLNRRYEEHYGKMNRPGYRPDFWDCLSGNMSLSSSLLAQSGGFDPAFTAAKHDDIEFGYRLAALGAHFDYRPQALGYHRFVKSVNDGLRDAVTNGASAVQLAHFHPDLAPGPAAAIWGHYPAASRVWLRRILARPSSQAWFTAGSRRALVWLADKPLPLVVKRPFFRLAYQLHFWQGVRQEAEPKEWETIIEKELIA